MDARMRDMGEYAQIRDLPYYLGGFHTNYISSEMPKFSIFIFFKEMFWEVNEESFEIL
jgi:hypothetical protein